MIFPNKTGFWKSGAYHSDHFFALFLHIYVLTIKVGESVVYFVSIGLLLAILRTSVGFAGPCIITLQNLSAQAAFNREVQHDRSLNSIGLKQVKSANLLGVEQSAKAEAILNWAKNEFSKNYQKNGKHLEATESVRQGILQRLIEQEFNPNIAQSLSNEMAQLLQDSVDPRFPLLPEFVQLPESSNFFRDNVKPILTQTKTKTAPEAIKKLEAEKKLALIIPESERKRILLATLERHLNILYEFEKSGQMRDESIYSKIADSRERKFPYGMRDESEFHSFGSALKQKLSPVLEKLKTKEAKIFLTGSAVTGLSFEPKVRELDLKRPFNKDSDYDVIIVIPDVQYNQMVRKGVIASDPMGDQGLRSIPYSNTRAPEKLTELLGLNPNGTDSLSVLKAFDHHGQRMEVPIEKVSVSVYGESYFKKRSTPGTEHFRPMMEIP